MQTNPTIEGFLARIKPRRKVQGIAAALLPFRWDGRVAVEQFQTHLKVTYRAGLTNAVNMDTGYANFLTDPEKRDVLRWTRQALGPNVRFVAGVYVEGREGELVSLYRRQMDEIVEAGGIPILFQTARLHGKSIEETVETYRAICKGYEDVIGLSWARCSQPTGRSGATHWFAG